MSKCMQAMQAMWEFASGMVEKHGTNGDDTLSDEEHRAWQDAAGLAHDAIRHQDDASPSEEDLVEFMLQRIEGGALPLKDIPLRLVRYGLMEPSDFVAEMRERMDMAKGDDVHPMPATK